MRFIPNSIVAKRACWLVSILVTFLSVRGAQAQTPDSIRNESRLIIPGGLEDDRHRLDQVLGEASTAGYLLRSAATIEGQRTPPSTLELDFIPPELRTIWNSDLPRSANEHSLWAGRGFNSAVRAGVRLARGGFTLTLAPEVTYSQNQDISVLQVIPFYTPGLYPPFIPLWYRGDEGVTIDMPIRFGDDSLTEILPGQSSLEFTHGPVSLGIGTQNHWWGPGIRNAIVMSSNAPGFPHAFVRTATPVATPLGDVEARWLIGRLETSSSFERPTAEQNRGLGAAAVTLQPRWEPDLTIGIARSVYGPIPEDGSVLSLGHAVFTEWSAVSARPSELTDYDQVFSAFGRWLFPQALTEIYAEWSRRELPKSFRDLFVHPNHSQGYTLGFQWARPAREGVVRLQAEVTNLEMSTTFRTGRTTSYYVSYDDGPGYTQRGRVIGASIGPGSSSQWLAVDYVRDDWRAGAFAGRTRWDNDAFYVTPYSYLWGVPYHGHDVSVLGGLRGDREFGRFRVEGEYVIENRMNYLFQNWSVDWPSAAGHAVNVVNHMLRLSLSPALD
jgi:hypothetical protein